MSRPSATNAEKKAGNIVVAIDAAGDIWIEKRRVDVRQVQCEYRALCMLRSLMTQWWSRGEGAHTAASWCS